jgi:hypothetical protein
VLLLMRRSTACDLSSSDKLSNKDIDIEHKYTMLHDAYKEDDFIVLYNLVQ